MNPVIFHIDVNSAFLSWSALEQLKKDPSSVDLRTVPSAIGGDTASRRGVITAKSVPAKAYGVKTGEPVFTALRKCPGLILLSSDFSAYRTYSGQFMTLLEGYSKKIEQVSIDEAFMDATGLISDLFGRKTPEELMNAAKQTLPENPSVCIDSPSRLAAVCIAAQIQERIRRTLKFTVNIGISENRLLAKMASDFEKPNRIHTLYPEEIEKKLYPLSIHLLHGCGKATSAKLRSLGIYTIKDAARTDLSILQSALGEKNGSYVFHSARGISSSVIHPEHTEAKGYSNETTTSVDITEENYDALVPGLLTCLSDKVASRMQKHHVFARTIGVSVKTDAFLRRSRQKRLDTSTNDAARIKDISERLLHDLLHGPSGIFASGHGIRLIGISGTNLDDGRFRQLDLFQAETALKLEQEKKQHAETNARLDKMEAEILSRFGEGALQKGISASHHLPTVKNRPREDEHDRRYSDK